MGDRAKIPAYTRDQIWGQAGGCCEMCSKPLDRGGAYKNRGNYSNMAHIRAYSQDGPRFDKSQSDDDRNSFENLMLLCPDCHEAIDSNPEKYPVEDLVRLKTDRERSIRKYIALLAVEEACVLTMTAPIHGNATDITPKEWREAIFSAGLSYVGEGAHSILDSSSCSGNMTAACSLMEENYRKFELFRDQKAPIALFAIGPQPLLIKLGTLIGDKRRLVVFQKQRETGSWAWQDGSSSEPFTFEEPAQNNSEDVGVIFAVSGNVSNDSLPSQFRSGDIPIVRMSAITPGVNIVRCEATLKAFSKTTTEMLDRIHAAMPNVRRVHVFPALPVSLAVTLGSLFNFNLIPQMIVYEKTDGVFDISIEIGAGNE